MKNIFDSPIVYTSVISDNIRSKYETWQNFVIRGSNSQISMAFLEFMESCEKENKDYIKVIEALNK